MLHIEVNGVDVSASYLAGSLSITSQSGNERSSFSLTLTDPAATPLEEQTIVIWDTPAKGTKETAGRIRRPKWKLESVDPSDDSPVFTYSIEAGHWIKDIERRPSLSKTYTDVTTGFIFRDLVNGISGFSNANVTSGGEVQGVFEIRQESVLRAFDRLANSEGWQWWIDDDKVFHFEDPQLSPAPFELTDDTYKEIAGLTLSVEPDSDNLANYITMVYKGKYSEGTANTTSAELSNEISGNGTSWLYNVKPGSKIRFLNYPNLSYTIDEIVNDELLMISGSYDGPSSSDIEYVIEDIPLTTTLVDMASVASMAARTGDDGIYADRIDGPSSYLTFDEAQEYLRGILRQRANPTTNISFSSTSEQIPGKIIAGMGVRVNLTAWGIADTTYQIRELTKKDSGTVDADGYPVWAYTIRIETKLYTIPARLRKIEDQLKGKGSESAESADYLPIISELVPLTESVVINEDVGWPPFVWGPSFKTWDTGDDWLLWTHTNTDTAAGNLQLSGTNLSGSAISPWEIQYSPNSHKTPGYSATIPSGATVTIEYRSADDQGSPGAWQSDLATLPDAKYIQVRISLTRVSSGDYIGVQTFYYSPHKSVLAWDESYWMGQQDTWDSQSDWDLWTLVDCNTADTVGSIVLDTGLNSGTATSPWTSNSTRTVAKVVTPTTVEPGVATITYEYRASLFPGGESPTAWESDIKALPDYPYIQVKATLTGTVGDRPELQKLEIYPK